MKFEKVVSADLLEEYFDRLWPLNRSLMGPDYRKSMEIISEVMPMEIIKFPTGSDVYDWTIPKEWKVNDAYFIGPDGKRYAEFKKNNLHLVGYSIPFRGKLTLKELKEHIYTLPEDPEAIPYITSYYKSRWGFCIAQETLHALPEGTYDVVVDTELYDGFLEAGEAVLPGESDEEIFFSSYLCHPSLANNELSGPLVLMFLYQLLVSMPKRRYTYRFALHPETLGAVAYLSARGEHLKQKMIAGYVITCVGYQGKFTYKYSKRADSLADRAAEVLVKEHGNFCFERFDPSDGSDERQYCSPGFNLPVGSLMRTMYGHYSEYHNSKDNKDAISFNALRESIRMYGRIVQILENNYYWLNLKPYGEPQLGKRGLYRELSAYHTMEHDNAQFEATFWLLSYADGTNDLIDIANISGLSSELLINVAQLLKNHDLLDENSARKTLM